MIESHSACRVMTTTAEANWDSGKCETNIKAQSERICVSSQASILPKNMAPIVVALLVEREFRGWLKTSAPERKMKQEAERIC